MLFVILGVGDTLRAVRARAQEEARALQPGYGAMEVEVPLGARARTERSDLVISVAHFKVPGGGKCVTYTLCVLSKAIYDTCIFGCCMEYSRC